MKLHDLWRSALWTRHAESFAGIAHWVPPFAVDALKRVLSEWEYLPGGWSAMHPDSMGWNHPSVAEAQEKHWPILVRNLQGSGPLGVSHFPWSFTRENLADHNAMMSFGYVLASAARKKDSLSVLDWGGGAGHYYLYGRALLPEVQIDYHCHDIAGLCRLGRKVLPGVRFHENAADLRGTRYDLVLSSSSLQYFEDWRETLRQLAAATRGLLYVARLPTVSREPSFVVMQRPYHAGYYTEYPSWFLNRRELMSCAGASGLELVREFVFAEQWWVKGAPEQGSCRGFLWRRPQPAAEGGEK